MRLFRIKERNWPKIVQLGSPGRWLAAANHYNDPNAPTHAGTVVSHQEGVLR